MWKHWSEAAALRPGRDVGLQPDGNGEIARAHLLAADTQPEIRPVEVDLIDGAGEAQRRQVLADPCEVACEFRPRDGREIRVQEFVEPLLRDQIGHERPWAGRMCRGDEVLEERRLQFDARQHHAGVPFKPSRPVEEARFDAVHRIEMGGEAEVERPDTDAGEVKRMGHGELLVELAGLMGDRRADSGLSGLSSGVPRSGRGRSPLSP